MPQSPSDASQNAPLRDDQIPVAEYIDRRARLLKSLNGAAALVTAGEHPSPEIGRWRPDLNFFYLTGISGESGAAVLFDPSNEDAKKRIILFLRPLNTELERWDGFRPQIGRELKERSGFETVMRSGSLPAMVTAAGRRTKWFACLHPFATYPAAVSPDLNAFQQVSGRVPGVKIEDQTELLPRMRAIKSKAELALIDRAVEATVAGYAEVVRHIRPGQTERHVMVALENAYHAAGGTGLAYNSIVGSGFNGTVLHYIQNDAVLNDGDLMVIDSAASFGGYAADITRTYPVSGKFTPDQRELYETVLKAELAGIKAARPGAKFSDIDQAARDVIERAGYGDAFIHGIGHPLGLHVHDVNPDHPLKAGMVLTVEPGIYLPEQKIGIRIEDDIAITSKGNRNLTAAVAKTVAEVEALLGG